MFVISLFVCQQIDSNCHHETVRLDVPWNRDCVFKFGGRLAWVHRVKKPWNTGDAT